MFLKLQNLLENRFSFGNAVKETWSILRAQFLSNLEILSDYTHTLRVIDWENDLVKRILPTMHRSGVNPRILTMHAFDEGIQFRQANISLQQRWLLINKEWEVPAIRIISGLCCLNQSFVTFSIIAKECILSSSHQSTIPSWV